jgi:hypothetical protein
MTSQIVSETIDENFPVAGQDNDSQGFRDNFNIIKTALGVATTEITDLQNGVARIDGNNNFDGNEIISANFRGTTLLTNTSLSNIATSGSVSYLEGLVYIISVRTNVTLTISDLPISEYACMRFILTGDNNNRAVTFTRPGGGMVIKDDGNVLFTGTGVTVNSSTNPIIIDAFTYDGGNTLFLNFVGNFS